MSKAAKKNERQDKKTHKLSDAEFWAILRENGGLFARTARAIERKYNISYGRSAVKLRAERNPEALAELEDIKEEAVETAEEGLITLMRVGPPNIRLSAIQFFLKTQARHRGYGDKPLEIMATAGANEATEDNAGAGFSLIIKVAGDN